MLDIEIPTIVHICQVMIISILSISLGQRLDGTSKHSLKCTAFIEAHSGDNQKTMRVANKETHLTDMRRIVEATAATYRAAVYIPQRTNIRTPQISTFPT